MIIIYVYWSHILELLNTLFIEHLSHSKNLIKGGQKTEKEKEKEKEKEYNDAHSKQRGTTPNDQPIIKYAYNLSPLNGMMAVFSVGAIAVGFRKIFKTLRRMWEEQRKEKENSKDEMAECLRE